MNLYNVLSNRYVGMSNFERLFAQKFGGTGGEIKELKGVPPLTFRANGQPLLDYRIYGNTVQSGTPTPENPIIPIGCGELEMTGVHAGQYKLPLTSTGQNVDIYLGEVQTTRRIKKLVLTGEETINGMTDANDGAKAVSYTYSSLGMTDIINNEGSMDAIPYPIYLSSHFKEKTSGYSSWFNINTGEIGADNAIPYAINRYLIFGTSEQTQADFKAYLAQQYAAGTPVTVWYVLAEPETGIMNEPLMKIGDYADTVSMEQAGVSIPTNKGSTTLDVDTTIKPSNVYIKYHT